MHDRAAARAEGAASRGAGQATSPPYRRDRLTWAAFAALFAFGFLNAALGPALPYLRSEEGLSYLGGALHQVAFAVGGGVAGLLATWRPDLLSRALTIAAGLTGAALAGLTLGYGHVVAVTIAGAFGMSLLGTSALIRLWAVLADRHGQHRTRAMTEGEVAVSLAGIVTALMIGGLAATALTWRFAFVAGAALVVATAMTVLLVGVPSPAAADTSPSKGTRTASRPQRVPATLLIVFAIVALEFSLSFWLASYLDEAVGVARDMAASMVSGLYAANLCGRVLTGYLAGKGLGAARLLVGSLVLCLAALPVLLLATNAAVALVGIVLVGAAIGAMFPLTSSLHVASGARTSDHAMGEILTVAALGQVLGPLSAGALASLGGLRLGLCVLPVLVLVAGTALARHHVATG